MRLITQKQLTEALFDHPYESAPDYHSAMSVVHLSDDGKLLIGYWHAPIGDVEISYGENVEYIYVIEGELDVESPRGNRIVAKPGDIIECGGSGEQKVVYHIREYVRALFIVYPQNREDTETVLKMVSTASPLHFVPKA